MCGVGPQRTGASHGGEAGLQAAAWQVLTIYAVCNGTKNPKAHLCPCQHVH